MVIPRFFLNKREGELPLVLHLQTSGLIKLTMLLILSVNLDRERLGELKVFQASKFPTSPHHLEFQRVRALFLCWRDMEGQCIKYPTTG